ncbi:MAG: phosphodiesterase [Geminicoccaceae bacterium]
MLVAQLTDLHLLPPGRLAFGKVDTNGCTERALAAALALDPAPDMLLLTGDIAHDGDPEAYAFLAALLEDVRKPVRILPGNHDDREAMGKALGHRLNRTTFDRYCFDECLANWRLIGLDSLTPGTSAGQLGDAQMAWLESRLAADGTTPTVIALHHPPMATGIRHMDGIMLQDADALLDLLKKHAQVHRLICGHVHRNITIFQDGLTLQISPGVAHTVELDLRLESQDGWAMEPTGFLLHSLEPAGRLVSHHLFVEPAAVRGSFGDPTSQ